MNISAKITGITKIPYKLTEVPGIYDCAVYERTTVGSACLSAPEIYVMAVQVLSVQKLTILG